MAKFTTRFQAAPSARFRQFIEAFGGVLPTAKNWGIPYPVLRRFVENKGGLSAATVATILERTGLKYEDLFVNEERS